MYQRKAKIFFAVLIFLFVISACNFAAPTQSPQITPTAIFVVASPSPASTVIVEPTLVATPKLPLTEADVPRVPVDQAKAALDSGTAIIVDVRTPQAYEASHIKGAISIPLGEIELNPTGLPLDKTKWIITYCT
jgi:Rhodanese-like domain